MWWFFLSALHQLLVDTHTKFTNPAAYVLLEHVILQTVL